VANAVALVICTVFNTAVHRELARGSDGQPHRGRYVAIVAGLLTTSLVLTTLALLAVDLLSPTSLLLEVTAVTVGNAVAAILRFSVLRAWVFRPAAPIDSSEVSS
jgi:hypothetical protein